MDNKEVKETSWQNETCDRRFYKTIVAFLSNLLIIVERVYRYICIYIWTLIIFRKWKKRIFTKSFESLSFVLGDTSTYAHLTGCFYIQCDSDVDKEIFFFFISCDNWKRYQNRRRKKKWKMRIRNYKSKEKYVQSVTIILYIKRNLISIKI